MQFPMATVFQATGEAATYTAPAGSPVSCYVKRVGGGRAESFGPVRLVVEDLSIHALREQIMPEVGGVIAIGGEAWTIEAIEPVERDAQSLLWGCRVAWGIEVEWFTPGTSDGSPHEPPDATLTYTASVASAGATTLTIKASGWTSGRIRAGDTITVDGTDYQATADVDLTFGGTGYEFAAVPLDSGLVGALAGGEAVTITAAAPGTTQTVRAAPAEWSQEEILGGVATGDRRLVVRAEAISGKPTTSDRVTLDGEEWTVADVRAVYGGDSVAAWVVRLSRQSLAR